MCANRSHMHMHMHVHVHMHMLGFLPDTDLDRT